MTQFKKIFCKNYFVPKKEKKYWKNYSPLRILPSPHYVAKSVFPTYTIHPTSPLSACAISVQHRYSFLCVVMFYWMDLLQIFRNYFLGSLYLHVLPLSVCLSVKILDRTSPPKLLDGFTSNFQELLLRIPIFA